MDSVKALKELLTIVEAVRPDHQEELEFFLKENIKKIETKRRNRKAEKEYAQQVAKEMKERRDKSGLAKQERVEKIKAHLTKNPALIVTAKDLCETIFKAEGLKSQALTRILIDLEKEGFLKVVGNKPKQVQKR